MSRISKMANFYFDAAEVFNIYKQSYNIKLPLHQILDDGFCNWIELHEKATNCSKMLVLPSLISLTAAMCGPKAPISLGCDEFAMGLRIDSPNRRELSRNVRMASQSPRMHRELVANGSPKF